MKRKKENVRIPEGKQPVYADRQARVFGPPSTLVDQTLVTAHQCDDFRPEQQD